MAYTIQRLEQAKALFRGFKPREPGSENESSLFENWIQRPYSLRRRGKHQLYCSTWLDNDNDSDYEPRARRAKRRRTTKKVKEPRTLVVTLKLNSKAGKAVLSAASVTQDGGDNDQMMVDEDVGTAVQTQTDEEWLEHWSGPDVKADRQPAGEALPNETPNQTKPPTSTTVQSGPAAPVVPVQAPPKTARKVTIYPIQSQSEGLPRPAVLNRIRGPSHPQPPSTVLANTKRKRPQKNKQNSAIGVTTTITTCYAHPMNLAYEPPDDGTNPCHWCCNFVYGILGLGKVRVKVLDFGDGRYIELDGGHVSAGAEPSRMCTTCALERMHIMRCAGHQIRPLHGFKPETFDFAAAFDSLLPTGDGSPESPKRINPWCMLCPNPAFFQCMTPQTMDKSLEPIPPMATTTVGCGLLLCERCAILTSRFGGNLSQVVAENERKDPENGSRADAGFLLPGSELHRVYTGPGKDGRRGGGGSMGIAK